MRRPRFAVAAELSAQDAEELRRPKNDFSAALPQQIGAQKEDDNADRNRQAQGFQPFLFPEARRRSKFLAALRETPSHVLVDCLQTDHLKLLQTCRRLNLNFIAHLPTE